MTNNFLGYLEASAQRIPDKPAYVGETTALTYSQLHSQSRRVGTAVARLAPRGSAVAIFMDNRRAEVMSALLGTLYAGCCHAPVDGAAPAERLRSILTQLEPALILCDEKHADMVAALAQPCPTLRFEEAAETAEDAALLAELRSRASVFDPMSILYTSGSTGVPKGVVQSHFGMIQFTEKTIERYDFREDEVFGNQSPFFYANSVLDMGPPMKLGATVYLLPVRCLSFPSVLLEQLNERRCTILTMTPSSYNRTAGVLTPGCLPQLRYLLLSGERLHWPTLRIWQAAAPGAQVWNHYGSTETSSIALGRLDRAFADDEVVPVGPLFDHVHVLFVDEDDREVPWGEPGLMLINNTTMCYGYYRDEARTRAAFVNDPLGKGYDEKFFRTGDLGRINERGELVVLGRADSQIKRMGYRMELGEVESALSTIPGCEAGCVLYDRDSGHLYCFWTGSATRAELTRALKTQLPRYAVPDVFVHLDEMPCTASMKVDRTRLRAMMKTE